MKKTGKTILLILALSLIMRGSVHAAYHFLLQQGIAGEVLRFHVLADSDSEEDQKVKYKVRDAVLEYLQDKTGGENTENQGISGREQMKIFLQNNLSEIERVSDQVLRKQGMSYRSEASLEKVWFPDRTYGDCTFPAGWYEALRVKLGRADGHNWWCVLYPKLCFSDSVHAVVEEDQMKKLEEVLTAEEYEELLKKPAGWKISFRWF